MVGEVRRTRVLMSNGILHTKVNTRIALEEVLKFLIMIKF